MSTIKYIDIDSTYRNRLIYPIVGDFTLDVNSHVSGDPATAEDPVLLAFPYETERIVGFAAGPPAQYTLSANSSSITNYYKGSYLEVAGAFGQILAYNGGTRVATLASSVGGAIGDTYTIRKKLPYPLLGPGPFGTPQDFQDTTTVLSPSFDIVYLGAAASSVSGEYTNKFLFFPGTSVPGVLTSPTGYVWRRITSYVSTNKAATVYPPLSVVTPIGTVYEILDFSYDNNKPLVYGGTEIMNNPVCETLSLINLIVPNILIEGSNGGTILNYPYVYVSLYSDKGKTWNFAIEGNNPSAKDSLFKVPISFNTNAVEYWLDLQGSLMHQNISFRQNDNLHIKIYLPDGTLLNFANTAPYFYFPDFRFPILSDPGRQIQAVFEVLREKKC